MSRSGARSAAARAVPRTSSADVVGLEDADPLGDLPKILGELKQRGMNGGKSVFLAYFVRFADEPAAAAAAAAARGDGWSTASYLASTGYVVRLSRQGAAGARDLAADRDYLRGFAGDHGARWEGLALEVFAPDAYWDAIAERFLRRKSA